MPPASPPHISSLIESAYVYQNQKQFKLALQTYDEAKNKWGSEDVLTDDQELFFELARAAIFESCGKDELALSQYFAAKAYSDRLAYNSPDKALVFCGIGSTLHHLGQH
jgi:tetratricopeptide (TPR) repeat protein